MASDSTDGRPASPARSQANGGTGRAVTIVVSVVAGAALGAAASAAVVQGGADIAGKVAGNGGAVAIIVALFVIAGFLWTGMMRICARTDRLGARFGAPVTSLENNDKQIAEQLGARMTSLENNNTQIAAQLGSRMTSLETRVGRVEGILMSRADADPTPPHDD